MRDILDRKLTLSTAQKSAFYEQIAPRLPLLSKLESILDNNQLIFRYNAKAHAFSVIEADYLLDKLRYSDISGNFNISGLRNLL